MQAKSGRGMRPAALAKSRGNGRRSGQMVDNGKRNDRRLADRTSNLRSPDVCGKGSAAQLETAGYIDRFAGRRGGVVEVGGRDRVHADDRNEAGRKRSGCRSGSHRDRRRSELEPRFSRGRMRGLTIADVCGRCKAEGIIP